MSRRRAKIAVKLSRVLVGVSKSIRVELSEGLEGCLARVDCHAANLAHFMTLVAEGLVIGRRVTNSQRKRHAKHAVTLLHSTGCLFIGKSHTVFMCP